MNKVKLIVLASCLLLVSMLVVVNPANASQLLTHPAIANHASSVTLPICEGVFEPTPQTPMLEFTDSEADAVIQQDGCGCKSCLNAALQLQGRLPLP